MCFQETADVLKHGVEQARSARLRTTRTQPPAAHVVADPGRVVSGRRPGGIGGGPFIPATPRLELRREGYQVSEGLRQDSAMCFCSHF